MGGMMSRLLWIAIFSILSVGCTQVRSEVTRFHTLPPKAAGETFIVLPYKSQEGSLEFQQYASLVERQMVQKGYRMASKSESFDYAIFIDYAIDGGRTTTSNVPIWGQTGGGTSYSTGSVMGSYGATPYTGTYSGSTYTPPTYGVTGHVPVTSTTFARVLSIHIVDGKQSTKDNLVTRFEGRARSAGSSANLPQVLPLMIEALFRDFPGVSGQTTTVDLAVKR
jgi:hypothetical protein